MDYTFFLGICLCAPLDPFGAQSSLSGARTKKKGCNGIRTVFFSLQSLWLLHRGKTTGVAAHCIACFQTQLILTTCHIPYRSHCGIIIALDSSEP